MAYTNVTDTTYSWFCPSYKTKNTKTELNHIISSAKIAEQYGFSSILTPADSNCLDPWTISTYILQNTKNIKPIVALRTGFMEPVYACRMIATILKVYGPRLDINIVTGSAKKELLKEGGYLAHQDRYKRTSEFIHIFTNLLKGNDNLTFTGDYYYCENAHLYPEVESDSLPVVYLAGSSDNAISICEKYKLDYLFFADTLINTKNRLSKLTTVKSKTMRVNIIVRSSKEEAIKAAINNSEIKVNGKRLASLINKTTESIGQKRIAQMVMESDLHDDCLWTGGVGGQTGSVPTLVGTADEIKKSLEAYKKVGVNHFIVSSIQSIDEIKRIGKQIIQSKVSVG
ncbi:LLM class flavin-dependent oxidoreductase [Alkalihalophilus marmarensis]|uniref:LLM class flavin-dependent oxidoreductase n=1 Tax=Alkalihalophilus marmarensis TaxID=521377 RepID=UPI002DBA7E0D|nr:LLM class flavin-dependent oxidoreductase [Alkalihalophilus marmarensis]MEC2074260.1 LLM class flavin-dependent oxidoreductase [Alkalihalophilus marmarensis]